MATMGFLEMLTFWIIIGDCNFQISWGQFKFLHFGWKK